MKVNVKCDKYSFRKEEQNINDWYGIECPECGKVVIIDDWDMKIYNQAIAIGKELGFALNTHINKKKNKAPYLNINIDTNRKKPSFTYTYKPKGG